MTPYPILAALLISATLPALEYARKPADPQPSGWPLTAEERAYVTGKAEFDRRPGRESNQHLPQLWPVVPTAGFFGGEGFILQKVTGPGTVFLDLSGEVVEKDLAPGERLLVHAGHVGVMDPTVTFDIQMVSGFKNILFGGEGLFLATLTGPGHVAASRPSRSSTTVVGKPLTA